MDHYRKYRVDLRIFKTVGHACTLARGCDVSTFFRLPRTLWDFATFVDGEQMRSLCSLDDLLDGLMRMMNGPADLAAQWVHLRDAEAFIHPRARRDRATADRLAPVRTWLDWGLPVRLSDGVVQTIACFRSIDLRQ
jgi:UDP-glucuronate decarboxylase